MTTDKNLHNNILKVEQYVMNLYDEVMIKTNKIYVVEPWARRFYQECSAKEIICSKQLKKLNYMHELFFKYQIDYIYFLLIIKLGDRDSARHICSFLVDFRNIEYNIKREILKTGLTSIFCLKRIRCCYSAKQHLRYFFSAFQLHKKALSKNTSNQKLKIGDQDIYNIVRCIISLLQRRAIYKDRNPLL